VLQLDPVHLAFDHARWERGHQRSIGIGVESALEYACSKDVRDCDLQATRSGQGAKDLAERAVVPHVL